MRRYGITIDVFLNEVSAVYFVAVWQYEEGSRIFEILDVPIISRQIHKYVYRIDKPGKNWTEGFV